MRVTHWTSKTMLALAVGMMLGGCTVVEKDDAPTAGAGGTAGTAGAGGSTGGQGGTAAGAGGAGAGGSDAGQGGTGAGAGGTEAGGAGTAGTGAGTAGTGAGTAGTGAGTAGAGAGTGGTEAGGAGTGGTGGSSTTKGQWVAVELLDETVDGKTYQHSVNDWVNGLWFDSEGNGLVGTYFSGSQNWGGTITSIAGGKAQKILASGGRQWLDPDIDVHFRTIHKVKSGWAVQTNRIGLVYLSTDGQTFARTQPGLNFENLANASYGWFEDASGAWWTGDNIGNLYRATSAPAPATQWAFATPKESDCDPPLTSQSGSGGYQWRRLSVSDDGQRIVYPIGDKRAVCVTVDGGATWATKELPNPPAGSESPFGVVFSSTTNGIILGRDTGGDGNAYVYYTTDGGLTWSPSTLPPFNGEDTSQFRDAAFAPGGQVGYIVGNKSGSSTGAPPLLYKTTDGGKTWLDLSKPSFAGSPVDPNGGPVLATVFAPDDSNIWIGGYEGLLIHHNKGGFND